MKKVYVAGKLNDMAVDYIKNMNRMMEWGEKVRKAGFAVFIPCIDVFMGMMFGDWEYKDYFDNSQPWLAVADAIFLVPGWETSEGTKREIQLASLHGIPIFETIEDLVKGVSV